MKQTYVIVWLALVFSQLVYPFVPIPKTGEGGQIPEVFPLALGFVAFTQAVAIVVLLRVRAFGPIAAGRLDPRTDEGGRALFVTLLIAWVLAEATGIHGLVLRVLQFGSAYWAAFSVAGLVLMWVARPWQSGLEPPVSSGEMGRTGTPLV